jgi:hypothetical protein
MQKKLNGMILSQQKEQESISSLETEIDKNTTAIKKLRRLIPIAILFGFLFSFFLPPIILSDGKPSDLPYTQSVILRLTLFFGIYIYSYRVAVNKRKLNIKNIKMKISDLEKQNS